MSSYLQTLQKQTNKALTLNGAVANKSSLNDVLDFFSLAGAMRNRPQDAVVLFTKAYFQDKQAAVRCLFYLRDVRGGQGERDLFRVCLNELHKLDYKTWKTVLPFVSEYGRFDDLFGIINQDVADLVQWQLSEDLEKMGKGQQVSLLAKWIPSENTSSPKTRNKAKQLINLIECSPKEYRKKVVALRKYIKLLEQDMSSNNWEDIDYSKLPSQAHRKHIGAFRRHDEERYQSYLDSVKKGESKINTSTLYTYEVFDVIRKDEAAANAMWANLPNYVEHDALVIADVSGSMFGRPMDVSVSLALYFAERNKGTFKDYFITFSDEPELVKVRGNTLSQKLSMIENANWENSTNIEAVFNLLLDAAIKNKENPETFPKVVYIISDMEFNKCTQNPTSTLFDNAKKKFNQAGFELPHLVFWNVDSKQNQLPANMYDNRVTLISGLSQSTFRYVVEGKTPLESMNDIINSKRYEQIVVE